MSRKNARHESTGGAIAAPLAAISPEAAERPGIRIRMLKDASTPRGFLRAGSVVVLEDEAMGRNWIAVGLAMQDKSMDGPPETK